MYHRSKSRIILRYDFKRNGFAVYTKGYTHPKSLQVLEKYSKIPPEQIEAHLHAIVSLHATAFKDKHTAERFS